MIEIRDVPYPSEDNQNGNKEPGKTFVDVYCWDEESQVTWDRKGFEHPVNLPGHQEDLVCVRLPGIFKQEEWSKPSWWAFWRKPELLAVTEGSGTFFSYARPGKKFKKWFWFDSEERSYQMDNPMAGSLREWVEVDEAQAYYGQMVDGEALSCSRWAVEATKILREGV